MPDTTARMSILQEKIQIITCVRGKTFNVMRNESESDQLRGKKSPFYTVSPADKAITYKENLLCQKKLQRSS